jgi:hypothetical protein
MLKILTSRDVRIFSINAMEANPGRGWAASTPGIRPECPVLCTGCLVGPVLADALREPETTESRRRPLGIMPKAEISGEDCTFHGHL